VQHQTPVSDNEPKAPYHYFISLFLSQRKEGSLAHKFAGGKGEDNGVDQASFKEVSPYREANDRKAKLLKFEQSVLKILSYLPRTTMLCMENLCAEEPTRS